MNNYELFQPQKSTLTGYEAIFRASQKGVDDAVATIKKIQMNAQELSDATEELRLFYNSTRIKPRKFNASVIGFELSIRGSTV